ncbi:MAG: hypothetical protein JW914_10580 [Syntrophaceae bacterium]|nr:hypothetical protein [Syntrophaceae bacterium]
MEILLYTASFFAFAIGVVHSFLGERYILVRLIRRDNLPRLFGGTEFTARTLRFAWHLTTIAWWGFAAIIILLARQSFTMQNISLVLALTFLATGATTLIISRGRHLAWIVFLFIGCVCFYAAIK